MKKSDFPIFQNNHGMIYLDSASTTQKPQYVIDGVNEFITHNYANIHRGQYALSENSEDLFYATKDKVSQLLNVSPREIFFTYNSTFGFNQIAQSLMFSNFLNEGDTVLLLETEHHANIVPWQFLQRIKNINIEFIRIDENFHIDFNDLQEKLKKKNIKVVAFSGMSNVTGAIYDLQKVRALLSEDTFFLVDGSQLIPHQKTDLQTLGADCLIFTGHKMLAYSGVGIVYLNKKRTKLLEPTIVGGGIIQDVTKDSYSLISGIEKFETGTPNIIGIVSLLKALEYFEQSGGYETLHTIEKKLSEQFLHGFKSLGDKVKLLGPQTIESRGGVFSFTFEGLQPKELGRKLAENNICVRAGGHCTHPFFQSISVEGSCRASIYGYNDESDVEKFFEVLTLIDK